MTVLNVHSPNEEKHDKSKDSLYEELEQGFDHFPMYHKKIRLGYFNAKLGTDSIFTRTFGNKSLHHDCNYSGVRVVKSPHQKLLKARCSRTKSFINTHGPILM